MMEAWQSSALGGVGSPSTVGGGGINPLASGGDAHYLDESIHPSTIRGYFTQGSNNPSNPTSTPNLIRGMKWLLASMSKGRDVSDFFPHVVKLTGATSLEVRKMVYMYLVQYSDHDDTCRELALLSINSFQRGLADAEQLIRALALRALTSIRVEEIIHIQILAVQTCALSDRSPYVRKCAANALSKLWLGYGRRSSPGGVAADLLDPDQRDILLDILKKLLLEDTSTMVLSSAVVAFMDMSSDKNENLYMLHGCYRKLCHLMTDMDEWGQVVLLDVLQRYCRANFTFPGEGSAVAYDREKCVRRMGGEYAYEAIPDFPPTATAVNIPGLSLGGSNINSAPALPPHPRQVMPKAAKRRVVKKAFYSDEEDESAEEELSMGLVPGAIPVVAATALPSKMMFNNPHDNNDPYKDEDEHLDEDHRLLLRSSIPLLKSRNSAVVLTVCRLHYYCGASSIKTRAALGKALVRIHRDKREIQYVVLTSIRTLADSCPSAFTPYLHDFFIKAMDPSFTRQIKLEILTVLALQPDAIQAVLGELRTYIRHDDKLFVQSSIRAVGKMVELATVMMEKQGSKTQGAHNEEEARRKAKMVALNCLYGLQTFMVCSRHHRVVGECILVMRQIMVQLKHFRSQEGNGASSALIKAGDPNGVQDAAMRRLMVVVLTALAPGDVRAAIAGDEEAEEEENTSMDDDDEKKRALPPDAIAAALWIVGEFVLLSASSALGPVNRDQARHEILRLAARSFPDLEPTVKLQVVHLATKCFLVEKTAGFGGGGSHKSVQEVCRYILSMGKVDVHIDVRDRARFESAILQVAESDPQKLSWQAARTMVVYSKPAKCSTLSLAESIVVTKGGRGGVTNANSELEFPFGTLSSLVGHRAGTTFSPLPPWATIGSASSLRDPAPASSEKEVHEAKPVAGAMPAASSDLPRSFYDSNDDEENDASSTSSSSTDEDESSSSSDESSSSGSSESSGSDETESAESNSADEWGGAIEQGSSNKDSQLLGMAMSSNKENNTSSEDGSVESSSDETESSESGSSSDGSSADTVKGKSISSSEGNLLALGMNLSVHGPSPDEKASGLEDLVMAPLVVGVGGEANQAPDAERDSSSWTRIVRHELAGGLEVQSRFLRGATAKREAKLLKIEEGAVIVQLKFQNM
jgi:AP-3 complex subunit beta